jgi:tetratricopeptide (TPR) repeat protein
VSSEEQFSIARELYEGQKYSLAEAQFGKYLAANPKSAEAHSYIAMCLYHQSEYGKALDHAKQAVRLDPQLAFAFYALSEILSSEFCFLEAELAIEEAIRLQPDYAYYHGTRAEVLMLRSKPVDALEATEHGLELDSESTVCLNARADALTRLGRLEEAETVLASSLKIDPDNPNTHLFRGVSSFERGDLEGSKNHFSECLRIDPHCGKAELLLFHTYAMRLPIMRWTRFLAHDFWLVVCIWWLSFNLVAFSSNGFLTASAHPALAISSWSAWGLVLLITLAQRYFVISAFISVALLQFKSEYKSDPDTALVANFLLAAMVLLICGMAVATSFTQYLWIPWAVLFGLAIVGAIPFLERKPSSIFIWALWAALCVVAFLICFSLSKLLIVAVCSPAGAIAIGAGLTTALVPPPALRAKLEQWGRARAKKRLQRRLEQQDEKTNPLESDKYDEIIGFACIGFLAFFVCAVVGAINYWPAVVQFFR